MNEFTFDLNGKSYRIVANDKNPSYNGGYSWSAYRKQPDGTFDKIPCSSRAEENAFPKSVAWIATAFVTGLNQKKGVAQP
jgi:hypothetical protein